MKEKYTILIIGLIVFSIITLISTVCIIGLIHRSNTIRAEGIVVDMKQEQSGHFLGSYDYFVQLNISIKWYEISETSYWIIEIGDYITIYETKRVVIN